MAVVSWPATSRVRSSSRISASLIGLPSSWRAWSISERTSSRSARSSAARRSPISRAISSSTRSHPAPEGGDRLDAVGADQQHRQQQPRVGRQVEEVAQGLAQRLHPGAVVDAEDGLDDDLQRDRLHPRPQLVGDAGGPAVDLARGDLGHLLAVGLHPLAVEGRQQQLALAHVRLLVEDEDAVVAEDRAQDLVALAGVEDLRVAGEDLFHQLRVGEHDPVALVGDLDREHRAEPRPALLEEPLRLARPDRGLQRPRHPRPRRQSLHRTEPAGRCPHFRRRLHVTRPYAPAFAPVCDIRTQAS